MIEKKEILMNWNIFFVCMIIVVFSCFTFYIVVKEVVSKNKGSEKLMEEKKSDNVDIAVMVELDNLEKYVNSISIPEGNKEKILKVIDFEKDYIKYSIIKELGNLEYEKLRK